MEHIIFSYNGQQISLDRREWARSGHKREKILFVSTGYDGVDSRLRIGKAQTSKTFTSFINIINPFLPSVEYRSPRLLFSATFSPLNVLDTKIELGMTYEYTGSNLGRALVKLFKQTQYWPGTDSPLLVKCVIIPDSWCGRLPFKLCLSKALTSLVSLQVHYDCTKNRHKKPAPLITSQLMWRMILLISFDMSMICAFYNGARVLIYERIIFLFRCWCLDKSH